MAHFQTPTPVKIDQLDLGQIQKDNALSALYDQRLQGMAYENRSRNALNDVLKVNPNATSGEVQNALAQAGYGASAPDITAKMGNNALLQAKIAKAQTDFISTFAPMVKDQSSLDMVRTKFMSTFGQDIPTQFHTYYDGIGQDALKLSLGAAQNIQLQRNDATGAAVGAPAGVDVGLWNNVNMARNNDQRAAQLQPYKVQEAQGRADMIPLQQQNIQSEIDARKARAAQPRVIMIPDPNDPLGMKKVPGYYDQESNSVVPMQVAPGDLGGQGPVPGQGGQSAGGTQGQFRSAPDVVSAFKAGKITRDQAAQILRSNGWAQ